MSKVASMPDAVAALLRDSGDGVLVVLGPPFIVDDDEQTTIVECLGAASDDLTEGAS